MKINTSFTKGIMSKILSLTLKRKLGYNVDLKLNDLDVRITDETAHVHLCIDAEMTKEELMKLITEGMYIG